MPDSNIGMPFQAQGQSQHNDDDSNVIILIKLIKDGGWKRQNSVSSLSALSRSPSPSTRTSVGTCSRTSPSPSCSSAQNFIVSGRSSSWFQQPQIELKTDKRWWQDWPKISCHYLIMYIFCRCLPPLPPRGKQYTGWRSYNCRQKESTNTPAYLQSPAQRLARSCSRL